MLGEPDCCRPETICRRATLVLALLLGTAGCGSSNVEPKVVVPDPVTPAATRPAKWALLWGDEFNDSTIDPRSWVVTNGASNVNGELEYYLPSNAYLENGSLVLKSEQRTVGGRSYVSGEVRSATLRTVQRGTAVEWRTQVPSGKGIWPANWLVGTSCDGLNGCGANWPPEIDVLEMKGSAPNVNVMTHWWGTYPNQQYESSQYTAQATLADGYHVYRLEWFPDSIVWYVDGLPRAKHTQNITFGTMQLVMNTAVGGNFDGAPNGTTVFPQYHRIDYVRVYRDTANVY